MTRTIVQIVTLDQTGDTMHRMKWPAEALAHQDPSLRVLNVNAYSSERYELGLHADLLVLFQTCDVGFLNLIEQRRKLGRKTLVEYNDNFYAPQPWSPIAKEWGSAGLHSIYEQFIKRSDGVIVTGPGLSELFAKFSVPVHILKNHMPQTPAPFDDCLKGKTPYPSFGWAGSLGHMGDLLASKPIIERVLQSVPDSIFHVMGNSAIPDVLGLAPSRIRYVPWGGMSEYFSFWESVWVGIAPMLATDYNRCRSDVKIVEMGAYGVAPVVSPLLPYEELVKELSLPTEVRHQAFSDAVVELLRSHSKRTDLAKRLHLFVSQHRVAMKAHERLELYVSFFPESQSTYPWPQGNGYFEFDGVKMTESTSASVLKNAQAKLTEKDVSAAIQILSDGLQRSPHDPDIHIALCKVLLRAKDGRFDMEFQRFLSSFPGDFRGMLLSLQRPMQLEELITSWRGVIAALRSQSEVVRRSVSRELCELMGRQLPQISGLVETAEELLLLYPYKHTLRVVVGQIREALGHNKEAAAHFEVLVRERRNFDAGGQEIATIEAGYLEALYSALTARSKGTLA